MPLKAVLDSLDGLPADVAKEYKKGDDEKFRLDVVAVDGVELADTTALKKALSSERTAARKANEALKEFEELDPKAARAALAKVEELKTFPLEKKVEEAVRAQKEDLIKLHKTELEKITGENKSLLSELDGLLVNSAATQAIITEKGSVDLLLPHVRAAIKMRKTDQGKFVAEVVDKEGNVRIGDTAGSPMSIVQLVQEMKGNATFARAFEPSGATGSGATGAGNGATKGAATKGTRVVKGFNELKGVSLDDLASGAVQVQGE